MTIIKDKNGSFGSRVTLISNEKFTITVSTAKEGFFKGLSTVIIDGKYLHGNACAKIIYNPSLTKSDRQLFHGMVTSGLDGAGNEGKELGEALQFVLGGMKAKDIIEGGIITLDDEVTVI